MPSSSIMAVTLSSSGSNFVFHDPANGEEWHGPENVKRYAAMLRVAFPDLHQTIEEQIAEGDKVAYR